MEQSIYFKEISSKISEARNYCRELSSVLPSIISASELNVWSKAPYKALCISTSLGHRMLDLVEMSAEALERRKWASAATLARAAMETSALSWELKRTMEGVHLTPAAHFHEKLDRMLLGHKDKSIGDVEAINVLTTIPRMALEFPALDKTYFGLCEVAHPNWSGALGLFAKTNYEDFETSFGPQPENSHGLIAANAIVVSISIQLHAINRTSLLIEEWRRQLPTLDDPRPPDPGH
ncbi:hypothetical protein [Caulobacter sp. CCH5-E12]|nr:hypothetical protein [Caulobacter sp. CCH5-E12]